VCVLVQARVAWRLHGDRRELLITDDVKKIGPSSGVTFSTPFQPHLSLPAGIAFKGPAYTLLLVQGFHWRDMQMPAAMVTTVQPFTPRNYDNTLNGKKARSRAASTSEGNTR